MARVIDCQFDTYDSGVLAERGEDNRLLEVVV